MAAVHGNGQNSALSSADIAWSQAVAMAQSLEGQPSAPCVAASTPYTMKPGICSGVLACPANVCRLLKREQPRRAASAHVEAAPPSRCVDHMPRQDAACMQAAHTSVVVEERAGQKAMCNPLHDPLVEAAIVQIKLSIK